MNQIVRLAACFSLVLTGLIAQDIAGDWQGTLKAGATELRLIVEIAAAGNGGWKARLISLDQASDDIPISEVTYRDRTLVLNIAAIGGTYEGKLSADGAQLTGRWKQGDSVPLDFRRATRDTAWDRTRHSSPHRIQFITVEEDVKLEVLDWGGAGRPLVLLTGLGNNAHVFDKFVPQLTGSYHVYGITRRGFGASSKPASGYGADRLADDVLAVLSALQLTRPVLAGHSIAGEELSSIGSRYPERVAGLIYLDAAYPYAYYDAARGDFFTDLAELRRKLDQLQPGRSRDPKQLIREVQETSLPAFERSLKEFQRLLEALSPVELKAMSMPMDGPRQAILAGQQKYTEIRSPLLAIFAIAPGAGSPMAARALAQAEALEKGIPTAKVVRIPNADHYVFRSNEAEVLREMHAFIASLPK